jgi:hypothetical protein
MLAHQNLGQFTVMALTAIKLAGGNRWREAGVRLFGRGSGEPDGVRDRPLWYTTDTAKNDSQGSEWRAADALD